MLLAASARCKSIIRLRATYSNAASMLRSPTYEEERLSTLATFSYRTASTTIRLIRKALRTLAEPWIDDDETIAIIERLAPKLTKPPTSPHEPSSVLFHAPTHGFLELLGSPCGGEWPSEMIFRNKPLFDHQVIYSVRVSVSVPPSDEGQKPGFGSIWNVEGLDREGGIVRTREARSHSCGKWYRVRLSVQ